MLTEFDKGFVYLVTNDEALFDDGSGWGYSDGNGNSSYNWIDGSWGEKHADGTYSFFGSSDQLDPISKAFSESALKMKLEQETLRFIEEERRWHKGDKKWEKKNRKEEKRRIREERLHEIFIRIIVIACFAIVFLCLLYIWTS